jgi:5-methyltetrahydrofolate--homocysteine methyltransferase
VKIIAEKINGTREEIAKAIRERDTAVIQDLALAQTAAGATWLDVNAGTHPSREPDDLVWLVETIQSVVETPLSLDSASPQALQAAIPATERTPMINSISGEANRLTGILPIVAEHGCPVIALALDGKKIAAEAGSRFDVIRRVMTETRAEGVPDSLVYVDPLVMTVGTDNQSAQVTFDIMRRVREEFPDAHLTLGLSNVSFGLPARSFINRYFLALAIQAGLDSAILDPLDPELQRAILTTELILGRDAHCLNFTRAWRRGAFG